MSNESSDSADAFPEGADRGYPDLITTVERLHELIAAIQPVNDVYLDTEADSLHHYFEKICLMQFTVEGSAPDTWVHFLLDPLAGLDLSPLMQVMQDKRLVFHGADYDLRLLRMGHQFIPKEIFDTMLAARLTGHQALGLDALVERYAGHQLDHKSQKADWSQRPLPPRMLKYAVEDTCFLPLITRQLQIQLEALNRTEWHRQQCQQLILNTAQAPARNPDDLWRIKGTFDFDRQQLAILRELWNWRDQEAQRADRPTYYVLTNDRLIALTLWAAQNPNENPSRAPKLPDRWSTRRRRALHEALQRAWSLPDSEWPQRPGKTKRPPYDPWFTPRMTRLKELRNQVATELKLDPSILAPNGLLEALSANPPKTLDDFSKIERWLPWQTSLFGEIFISGLVEVASQPPPPPPPPRRRSRDPSSEPTFREMNDSEETRDQ